MTQPDLFSAKTEWFDIEVARNADLNRVLAPSQVSDAVAGRIGAP